ncbi:MAG TPA: type II toxin-antitoxin system prevent-host-death family antitoxin [Acidimicrobiales bacterium]|nr:type II toxin-antitoxin system prevent-host-death family antitoxin [Acidimicrobiales bacterium]
MSTTVSVSQARATLPTLLDRVLAGEEVTITRHGQPVAVVVRPDALWVRRAERALAGAQAIHELLERGRRTPLASEGSISPERAEALIAEIRAGRDSR